MTNPVGGRNTGLPPRAGAAYARLTQSELEDLREPAIRAIALAEALFAGDHADVIVVRARSVWCAKGGQPGQDVLARYLWRRRGVLTWIDDIESGGLRKRRSPPTAGCTRFLAAAPICLRDGAPIAVLRLCGERPRSFDAASAARLEALADLAAADFERRLGRDFRPVRELFDQAPGFMAIVRGPDHVYEMVNPAYVEFMGDRPLLGRPARVAAHDLASQGFLDLCDEVRRTGLPYIGRGVRVLVQRVRGAPLQETYADFVFQPLKDAEGEVSGIFCQGHEVTKAKIAEDELRASRGQLEAALSATQAIFDHSHDVICTLDAEGIFTKVSQHAAEVWGYEPGELVGRNYLDLVHPDDVAASREIGEAIRRGRSTSAFSNRYLHRDGEVVPMMWSSVWSEPLQTMFAIGRDMREHVAAEEKLRQAQKMEAVGRLTGGMAHDFNNLLTAVIGSAEILSDALVDRPELKAMADLVLDSAERGAELVSRLLAFSRRQPLAPQPVDCARLMDSLVKILSRTLGEDIQIEVAAPQEPLHCLADSAQLTSALLNLCLNARDAMPDGGRISISAHREPAGAANDVESTVVLRVADTGQGMTRETRERALEPFFTTKPVGEGSGLGLSMVYGFVTQSGGRMDIDSAPGRGARVTLRLPESPAPADTVGLSPPADAPHPARHVLLVEDDPRVRSQVERHLSALGYRVTPTAHGPQALQRVCEADDIDLLMTDMVMPGGLNGRQLAEEARRLRPGLRVLFTSGYTEEAVLPAGDPDARFLAKPYRRADLARTLAAVLGHA